VRRALSKIAIYTVVAEHAPSGKRQQVEATNCGKFVAAFCRLLPLGSGQRFFVTNSLGDGVSEFLPADAGKTSARNSRKKNFNFFADDRSFPETGGMMKMPVGT
jgi:hypothetical protein